MAGVLTFQASPASAALSWSSWDYYYAGTSGGQVKCASSRSGVDFVVAPGPIMYPYTASGTFLWKDYLCSNWDLQLPGIASARNMTMKEPMTVCGGWTDWKDNPNNNPYAEAGAVTVAKCGSANYFSYGEHKAVRFGSVRTDASNSSAIWIP